MSENCCVNQTQGRPVLNHRLIFLFLYVILFRIVTESIGVFVTVHIVLSNRETTRSSSLVSMENIGPVSYTHLDVYKRQV